MPQVPNRPPPPVEASPSDEEESGLPVALGTGETFEASARNLRLTVLELTGLVRRLIEDAMSVVLERRFIRQDDWEDLIEKAAGHRRKVHDLVEDIVRNWWHDERCQVVAEGAVTLNQTQAVCVTVAKDLWELGEVLCGKVETQQTHLVEPLYDFCYESLRSLGTAFADGDPGAARVVVEKEDEMRHLTLLAQEQLRKCLEVEGEEKLPAWELLLAVKSLKQLGLTTIETGRDFLVSGMVSGRGDDAAVGVCEA